jgi:putative PEP-CTERM system integral membrane protein
MNPNPVLPVHRARASLAGGLFWAWNAIFLAFMLFGFAPLQLPMILASVRNGTTPAIYLVLCLVLIALPLVAVIIGGLFLRKLPTRLFALGYVVEWPLLLILLFRFFLIREGNPAITVLLVWLAVGEAAFIWHLFDRQADERRPFWIFLRLAGLTLLFAGTIYAAVWLAFYVPPVAVLIGQGVGNMVSNFGNILRDAAQWGHWYDFPLAILGFLLLIFSGSLIVLMPVVAPILAGRAWLHNLRLSRKLGLLGTLLVPSLALAAVLVVLGLSMAQPQQEAFKLLESPPATPQQAQFLLQHEEQIRAGLLNAYLGPFRYMSSVGEVRHISGMYESMLNAPQPVAFAFEQAYEIVIQPLLYLPVHPVAATDLDNMVFTKEPQQAAILYQNFFDTTIAQGERPAIVEAVRSTYNGSQAELAWQAVDDREVHLNRQEINLTEHGDWAEVQIHEVYENRTSTRQEVQYYFNLPESAVITGLWLGNDPDRNKAFVYQVVPRGAAQAEYRNEIRYNRDPALVEQIGPRQYRLRAFPVEPRVWVAGSDQPKPGPELHLWMTYRAVAAANGAWPLPQLAEKRNIFWDGQTTYLVNGKPSAAIDAAWLSQSLPATRPAAPAAHRVDFPGGQTVLARPAQDVKISALPAGLRLAVVLDRSFSMGDRTAAVKQAITSLKGAVGSGPDPDLYLTSSQYRGDSPARVSLASLDPDQVIYFGGQNAAELLAQFQQLQAGKQYDLIVVLTDNTGYELAGSNIQVQAPDAPLWVVHLGGSLPLGYDDPTLQAIQASGGGLAASVEEALARYAASREAPGKLDLLDGYVWQTLPTSEADAMTGMLPADLAPSSDEAGFAALAARRVILAEMAQNHGKLDQLPILDQLNQLAVDQSIVTPYSSMLVLVNDLQQNRLERLLAQDDRYQREVENIADTALANAFAVTGVPEPEEWLLLGLVAILLCYVAWRRRAVKAPLS